MKCAFHPDRSVAGYCAQCGRALCAECFRATPASGTCQACIAQATDPTQPMAPAQPPPAQPSGRRFGWAAMLACFGLLALLAVVAVVLVIVYVVRPGASHGPGGEEPVTPPAVQYQEPVKPEEQGAGPGQETALAFARSRKPGWAAVVTDHSEDWRSAYVVIGPSEGDWRTWLDLQWDDGQQDYVLNDEGPIAVEEGGDEEQVPDIYKPGEEVAKEAALAESPDWVAKVVEHSDDWKSVTVWIGPPQSEFVWAIKLKWRDDIDCYEVVGSEDVPYPE